jgi:aromatic-L-amino-acid decarboxylase
MAPVPMSVVCFRARPAAFASDPAALDRLNARLMDQLNASGRLFLSHTKLDGAFTLRLAVGHIRTTEQHLAEAWARMQDTLASM